MKAIFIIITIVLLLSGATILTANAQNLIAEYNFDGDLLDALGGSTLSKFSTENDGYNHNNSTFGYATDAVGSYSYWTSAFQRGGGLWVDVNTDISTNYSVGIRFSFENTTTSYRKIIDFKNMNSDNGFYFYSGGHLNFYPDGSLGNSITQNNQIVDIIITRSSDNTFKAYIVVNNVLINELNISDSQGNAIAEKVDGKPRFRFFHDDIVTSSEATPGGKVYSIKIWDGPITDIGVAMNNSWTGTQSSVWNSITNWSKNSIPVSSEDIVIPDANSTNYDPAINITNAVCNNLTINSGGLITINSGKALTVNGTLTNNAGNTGLILKSGSSLIENSGAAAIVEREITGNQWHLISSPVSNAASGMFLGKYLQMHHESTNLYTDITPTTGELTPMKGFALWGDAGGFTASYAGMLNAGTLSYSTAYSGAGLGWNLAGNPYPSSIDWDASSGWTKTAVYNATYLHINQSTWASYVGGVQTNGGSRYIAPAQGFFVKASAAGTLGMTDAVRVHNATTFFKNSGEVVPNLVRLEVSGNNYRDEAVVRFLPEATAEFDGDFDAYKIYGDVAEAAQIYTTGSTPLAINSLPEREMVPVGLHAGVSGIYTIAATEIKDLQHVTLEDTKTGIFTDLLKNSYPFSIVSGDDEQRFVLHFGPLSLNEPENAFAAIYSDHGSIYVDLKDNVKGDINLYTITGQLITTVPAAKGINKTSKVITGNYIVKVITNRTTMAKKVFVQ